MSRPSAVAWHVPRVVQAHVAWTPLWPGVSVTPGGSGASSDQGGSGASSGQGCRLQGSGAVFRDRVRESSGPGSGQGSKEVPGGFPEGGSRRDGSRTY